MGINFPNTPIGGQVFDPATGILYQWDGVAWNIVTSAQSLATALSKNIVVNPGFIISQETGGASSAVVAAHAGYYASEQWQNRWSISPGTQSAQRVALGNSFPGRTSWANGVLTGTAKAALAAGDFSILTHPIEGYKGAEFGWGTPKAIPVVVRFSARHTIPGTYSFRIANSPSSDRSYVQQFALTVSDVWQQFEFAVPPDTVGTWGTNNARWGHLEFVNAVGSTFVGVAGWQAGNFYAGPGQANGVGVAAAQMLVAEVGLYADPGNTGKAPPFEVPDFGADFRACCRYWQWLPTLIVETSSLSQSVVFPVAMRAVPTIANGGAGFAVAGASVILMQPYQTTRAYQSLTLNARM